MIPDFLFEKVVYLLSLFWMYSIWIFTRPLVFLPGAGFTPSLSPFGCVPKLSSVSLMLELLSSLSRSCILEGEKWVMEKGSVEVWERLYTFSPSIVEVIPAGCPAALNFLVKG